MLVGRAVHQGRLKILGILPTLFKSWHPRGKFKSGPFEDDGTQMNLLFFNDAVVTETLPVLHPTSLRKTAVPNEKKGSVQIGNDRATMP